MPIGRGNRQGGHRENGRREENNEIPYPRAGDEQHDQRGRKQHQAAPKSGSLSSSTQASVSTSIGRRKPMNSSRTALLRRTR